MLDAALLALGNLFGCPCVGGFIPETVLYVLAGTLIGLALGAIPGLGGISGLALLIPLTISMDPGPAIGMLLGMLAATTASDSIPAIFFAVPGTAGAQATILDGHAMARNGEAGRALGAAYTSSLLGGLIAAVALALAIPVLRPIVLAFASPEFFMLGVMGMTMVAVLAKESILRGVVAAGLGLVLAMIGRDPVSGILRWDFGQIYLYDGIPLVVVGMGLFAIPELTALYVKGQSIADRDAINDSAWEGQRMQGIKDTLRNWPLVVRSSLLGTWLAAIPGVGITVIDWIAYASGRQSVKGGMDTFGTGDVRGVIAPESAVNAKDAGGLIPTLAFGVPGSASMALFLVALNIHGVTPGPELMTRELHLAYFLIWALVLSNVLAAVITLSMTGKLAKLATIDIRMLMPAVLVAVVFAAYQASNNFLDVVALLGIGALGWIMRRYGWPRPPLLLAFVLQPIVERYYWISRQAYGATFLLRPISLIIIALAIISTFYSLRGTKSASRPVATAAKTEQ